MVMTDMRLEPYIHLPAPPRGGGEEVAGGGPDTPLSHTNLICLRLLEDLTHKRVELEPWHAPGTSHPSARPLPGRWWPGHTETTSLTPT